MSIFFESGTTHQPVRTGRTEEMVSRSVHHQNGERERSGYADSRRLTCFRESGNLKS